MVSTKKFPHLYNKKKQLCGTGKLKLSLMSKSLKKKPKFTKENAPNPSIFGQNKNRLRVGVCGVANVQGKLIKFCAKVAFRFVAKNI